jgi:hypothetical protein
VGPTKPDPMFKILSSHLPPLCVQRSRAKSVLSNFPTDCSGKLEGKKRIKQLKTVVYYLYFTSLNFYESFRISAEAIKLSNAEF